MEYYDPNKDVETVRGSQDKSNDCGDRSNDSYETPSFTSFNTLVFYFASICFFYLFDILLLERPLVVVALLTSIIIISFICYREEHKRYQSNWKVFPKNF